MAAASGAEAANTPEILLSKGNKVPACVTPEHLMTFMEGRNKALPAKFREIAADYKRHGEALHIRWDYAFYQMLVETNYLKFVAGPGKRGDVSPGQNNFAGLGATGHRVPGESFPDVDTGVLARDLLRKAGFAPADYDSVEPLLKQADANMTIEKQMTK